MTRRELIELCLGFADAYEDYPFGDITADPDTWTVMRHRENKKSFALIFERGGLCVNLKCEPLTAQFLREQYEAVSPAYHMNKMHWISVILDSTVTADTVTNLLEISFDLTNNKK